MIPDDLKRCGERPPFFSEGEAGALFAAALFVLILLDRLGVFQ